jgi:hypothetical protein
MGCETWAAGLGMCEIAIGRRRHSAGALDAATAQLACQEPPLSAEHIDEIIGHRTHARNFRKVAAGQAFSERDLHKATIIGATYRGRSATP